MKKWYDALIDELDNYVYVVLALVLVIVAPPENKFAAMLIGALLVKIKL